MILSELLPHLIYQFGSERDLILAIEEISQKFTKNRERIGDYLKDPRLVAAYTAFYLTTNIPKLEEVLKWMPESWIETLKTCDFVDLGAGPGTFSLAWNVLNNSPVDYYQIETSLLMREQAKKLWNGFSTQNLNQSHKWEWQPIRPKFLLFGHSANEMTVDDAVEYIDRIGPEHILFIEPGTKEFFPKMLAIRDYLIQKKFEVLYPCPTSNTCPMKNSSGDWCHQFIQVKQDSEIERISQMARKDRKLLPLTVHAYSKSHECTTPAERIVRVLPETKFSFEWEVCQNNVIERYQVMKRDLKKSELKELSEILSGSPIETETIKIMEKLKRVKLISK